MTQPLPNPTAGALLARAEAQSGAGQVLETKAYEVETVAHEVLPQEAHRFLRWGVILLLLFFGGFVVWAVTAPLDAGVPAPGVTIVESKRKTVAHLTGGIVKAILVKDMEEVREGQPLILLDDTPSRRSTRVPSKSTTRSWRWPRGSKLSDREQERCASRRRWLLPPSSRRRPSGR